MQTIDTKQMMSDAKFFEAYSRFIDSEDRYETWNESVVRVMDMHREKYAACMTPDLEDMIMYAQEAYLNKRILGAQRALQFGGEQLFKHEMRMYNCFSEDTSFVTSAGLKSFTEYNHGDEVSVLTHTGAWKPAVVKSYGEQSLYKVTMQKTGATKDVYVTKDHRWILHDGTETTELKVGDRLYKEPQVFANFNWDSATSQEKKYWCYGMVFGDGSVNGDHSHIRLCGADAQFEQRFVEMGWKTSSSESSAGDVYAYTGKYLKTAPDPVIDSPALIRAFVAGYLQADGIKAYSEGGKQYTGIQATGEKYINFIRTCFPIAGVHIVSETDLTGQETNFGTRPLTSRFVTNDYAGSKYNAGWKVSAIEYSHDDVVWCLEVEDDKSFVLEAGIVTGNCVSSYADRPKFFGEFMYMLLCGAGAGFSVQTHHVSRLPALKRRGNRAKTFVVPDSIEGWASAFDVLLSSFFVSDAVHPEYQGCHISFDLTNIRPKGSLISGGFKAPGPEPLRKALDLVEAICVAAVDGTERKLKSIEAYDICMHMADAVLSGGVRRSATICLFSFHDQDMMNAKTGNWYETNPQRGRSNNSAITLRDTVTRTEFHETMEKIQHFGEPGFILTDNTEFTYNPCVEIGKLPVTEDGVSGWQGCNLAEINGGMCVTPEEFYIACKAASIICTLQAGYTNFRFLGEESKRIFEREALIGVSVTGWMNNPDVLFDKEVLKTGANLVKAVNKEVAKMISINPAARTTCVKPSGNASVLLQTASGIHGEHSPFYIRNVQMAKNSEVAQLIKQHIPSMISNSVWANESYCISFPVVAPETSIFKKDLHGVKQLEYVKLAQEVWVEEGTDVSLCTHPDLRHNVSNTITVDDWEQVADYIYDNRYSFAGVSLLGMSGDKDYAQAPNTEVLTPDRLQEKYDDAAFFASGLIVDALEAFDDDLASACNHVLFNTELEESKQNTWKIDWCRRFRQFADNHFGGDLVKTSYCLKDVQLLHQWNKIQRQLREINWVAELHKKSYTDIDTMGAIACSGTNCEVNL